MIDNTYKKAHILMFNSHSNLGEHFATLIFGKWMFCDAYSRTFFTNTYPELVVIPLTICAPMGIEGVTSHYRCTIDVCISFNSLINNDQLGNYRRNTI